MKHAVEPPLTGALSIFERTCAYCGARFRVERVSDVEAAELLAAASLVTLDDLAKSFPTGLSRRLA